MAKERVRRLAAVWFADIVGYTSLSASHEDAALAVVDELQQLSPRVVEGHGGRVVKFVGDAVLAVFDSADAALKAALELRREFRKAPTARQYDCQLTIGIHLGEVVEAEDGDVYGDGVNVASRVQGKANAGQILATRTVVELMRGRPEFQIHRRAPWIRLKGLGAAQLFNVLDIDEPPPPRRIPVNRAIAVGVIVGVVAFVALVVNHGFSDPSAANEAPAELPAGVVPQLELDAGTDAFFAGELERARNRLQEFTEPPLSGTPEAEVALRYLARTDLAMGRTDLAHETVRELIETEPPMRLLLPTVDSDSLLDIYYEVRTDSRRRPTGEAVRGIVVFDLRLASDVDDPALSELGSQVAQMLVSELDGSGGDRTLPWEVRYPWDGLMGYAGEGGYEYFNDRVLGGQMLPATHAMLGRLAIRGGQLSLFVRVYELATGGVVASVTETGKWPDALFDAIEAVGADVTGQLLEVSGTGG